MTDGTSKVHTKICGLSLFPFYQHVRIRWLPLLSHGDNAEHHSTWSHCWFTGAGDFEAAKQYEKQHPEASISLSSSNTLPHSPQPSSNKLANSSHPCFLQVAFLVQGDPLRYSWCGGRHALRAQGTWLPRPSGGQERDQACGQDTLQREIRLLKNGTFCVLSLSLCRFLLFLAQKGGIA